MARKGGCCTTDDGQTCEARPPIGSYGSMPPMISGAADIPLQLTPYRGTEGQQLAGPDVTPPIVTDARPNGGSAGSEPFPPWSCRAREPRPRSVGNRSGRSRCCLSSWRSGAVLAAPHAEPLALSCSRLAAFIPDAAAEAHHSGQLSLGGMLGQPKLMGFGITAVRSSASGGID